MRTIDIVLLAVTGLAVAGVVTVLVFRALERPQPGSPVARPSPERASVTLELEAAHPESPPVKRLVSEAAGHIFAAMPDVTEVEVRSRSGAVLGHVTTKPRVSPEVAVPRAPAPQRAKPPSLPPELEEVSPGPVTPHFEARERERPSRPLVEQFDLPDSVARGVRDPNDLVDLVRAILEEGHLPAEVDLDVVRSGEDAIVIIDSPIGRPLVPDALNHAYLRFQQCGAQRGAVLSMGIMDPGAIRRREMMAPALRHVGPDAVQRMADAVALGANPLRFVSAPPVAG